MYVKIYIHKKVRIHVYSNAFLSLQIIVCMYVCMNVYLYVCTVCVYIYCAHIYLHVCLNNCTFFQVDFFSVWVRSMLLAMFPSSPLKKTVRRRPEDFISSTGCSTMYWSYSSRAWKDCEEREREES